MRGCPCLAALKWHTPECRSFAPWFKGILCLLPEPSRVGVGGFWGGWGGDGKGSPTRGERRGARSAEHASQGRV